MDIQSERIDQNVTCNYWCHFISSKKRFENNNKPFGQNYQPKNKNKLKLKSKKTIEAINWIYKK
jgi:hypothetical protein